MQCISPLSLKRGDVRTVVPCGKCNFCLQAKRADWTFRLKQELKVCRSASFLTLTYDDSHLPVVGGFPTLRKDHMQKFMKRLRKETSKVSDLSIRYYSVGEYGTRTERPHYHSIMFNVPLEVMDRLRDIWSLGQVMVGTVTGGSIHYVTKYHLNKHNGWEEKGDVREKPFVLSLIAQAGSA